MAAYKIGNFTFDTEEEYARGLEDAKKIEKIQSTVDLNEPETALRLYWLIRTGKIKFGSKVGKKFFLDIADAVAKSAAKNMTQAQAPEQQAGEEPRQGAQDRSRKILGAVCVTAAFLCFGWYFWSDYTNHRGSQANEYLKMLKENPTEAAEMVDNDTFFSGDAPELAAGLDQTERENEPPPPVLPEYEAIVAQHSDFAGWITIDGTKIDYPVMLTPNDGDYYLKRNVNGEDDINGTLFMDPRTDLVQRSTNIIIYGHNMKSGAMFGSLKKYLDEDYWREHAQIRFDTIYEKGTYEVFAVCLAKVQYRNSQEFRYYDFIQADSEEAFNDYLDHIIQLSVFTGTDLPVYGDELLTLSTCNNFTEDGRLFLVAKKCREAE